MEFGLYVSNMEFERLREVAQAAEALGYDLIAIPDHIVHERPGADYDPRTLAYDPIVAGAVILEATRKIRLAHTVLCNLFRHPVITAQALVSLDRLSGGRLIAGLGAGWTKLEFEMTGIPFPEVGTRLRMLDEALVCIRSLWTRERTTFSGEFYNLREAILWPKPVQTPHPPILVGGGGRGLLRVAARHADIVNIILESGRAGHLTHANMARVTDGEFKARVAFVRDEAGRHGRDPHSLRVSNSIFSVTLTGSRAETKKAVEAAARTLGISPEEAQKSPLFLIGTPEDAAHELRRRIKEWDATQFIMAAGSEAMMRRLADEVLRHV